MGLGGATRQPSRAVYLPQAARLLLFYRGSGMMGDVIGSAAVAIVVTVAVNWLLKGLLKRPVPPPLLILIFLVAWLLVLSNLEG